MRQTRWGKAQCLAGLVVVVASACGRAPENHAPDAAPSIACEGPERAAARGERRQLVVGGETRSYILDAPPSVAGEALPLVLSFHGFRGSAWRHRWWTGMAAVSRRERFIVVHPEGREGVRLIGTTGRGWDIRWGETRDVEFVRALLEALEAERCIDPRRVYATGMSNGGFFASLLGCALSERIVAVAPVAGAMPLGGCVPVRPPRVLMLYGRADGVVPADLVHGARDWWAEAQECGPSRSDDGCDRYEHCAAELVYCEGTQAHRWPSDASERIWRFFAGAS